MRKIICVIFSISLLSCTSNSNNVNSLELLGVIIDADGQALSGVTVTEKETSNSTTTNFGGAFKISIAKDGILLCSLNGYNTQEVSTDGATNIDIQMAEAKKPFFLCIGQSNMAGRATVEAIDVIDDSNILLFNNDNEWEAASNPLNKYSTIRKDLSAQGLSPSNSFAKAMMASAPYAYPKIGLVVNARGGTHIDKWAKGALENYYGEALSRTLEAKKTGVLKGIIWHQGETGRNVVDDIPTHMDKLKMLFENLRADLSQPNLPIVIGQIGKWKEAHAAMNIELAKVSDYLTNADYVDSDGLTNIDESHFDSASQRVLGERYAVKMIQLLGE